MKIQDIIGNTPLVEIQSHPNRDRVKIYAKLEGQNPGGSVKDRAAYHMIRAALDRGDISPGDRLVEATSGNTGIALALIANLYGLEMTLVMPENATEERKKTMRALGAKLILTPEDKTIEYARSKAEEMQKSGEYYMLDQFSNDDNWLAHYHHTGPEIWNTTEGQVTHFVSSMGTTGTIMGTSRFLKEKDPAIQIIGVQPCDGSSIPGIRRWSSDFMPKIYDPSSVDEIIDVSEEQAVKHARRLAKEEGIFCGISSGGAYSAALRVSDTIAEGILVFIVCDRGDRYLSSQLVD